VTGNYNPKVGPLINVAVMKWDPTVSVPDVRVLNQFQTLVDTGASCTCISDHVIEKCELEATGIVPMTGATGTAQVDQFSFAVGFIFPRNQDASGSVDLDMNVQPVQGLRFHKGIGDFDVLLGRDIICRGAFSLSFDGHFILSI